LTLPPGAGGRVLFLGSQRLVSQSAGAFYPRLLD